MKNTANTTLKLSEILKENVSCLFNDFNFHILFTKITVRMRSMFINMICIGVRTGERYGHVKKKLRFLCCDLIVSQHRMYHTYSGPPLYCPPLYRHPRLSPRNCQERISPHVNSPVIMPPLLIAIRHWF